MVTENMVMGVASMIISTNCSWFRPNAAISLFFVRRDRDVLLKVVKVVCLAILGCLFWVSVFSFTLPQVTSQAVKYRLCFLSGSILLLASMKVSFMDKVDLSVNLNALLRQVVFTVDDFNYRKQTSLFDFVCVNIGRNVIQRTFEVNLSSTVNSRQGFISHDVQLI